MSGQLTFGPEIDGLLDELHARSGGQEEALGAYFSARAAEGSMDWNRFDDRTNRFLADKLVALDREKGEFCHQICRALGARRVVEAGTSYGVSTMYLAAAVRDNGGGVVIATENEPEKAAAARMNWERVGLSPFIDLREGDLRETLREPGGPIDFLLIDIWTPMAEPALALVAPRLRIGAVVVCDNTAMFRDAYSDYFAFVNDPAHGLSTMTLPFSGGLEFTVRVR